MIIGRNRHPYDPYRSTDSGALVLQTGRPVLTVPPEIQSLAAKRVVIAWKDTREARRAVQDALPFLQGANEIIVMEVIETGSEQDSVSRLKDVAGYLSRHGIAAVAEWVRPVEDSPSGGLIRVVEEQSIDLIVSGAYGHTRLGEWMFGGMNSRFADAKPRLLPAFALTYYYSEFAPNRNEPAFNGSAVRSISAA